MRVAYDGDNDEPEVQISGEPEEYRDLGETLKVLGNSCDVEGFGEGDEYYPEVLRGLRLELTTTNSDTLLTIAICKQWLCLSGSTQAFVKLGQSLLNFFDEDVTNNAHLHLDYFEGNELLAPTTCHLTLECA
ncbi:hypothetical protein [uncultured Gimesia sp.]|uniref:Imm32 family immunity protein n=1 Tax=uncultured Gimesia sp. TaxID=1678688 RepID=UPI0030D76F0A|tara:strand:- start:3680 stop:4075 length:396 start_codon:yes stop_codon:yes gene_type:complete